MWEAKVIEAADAAAAETNWKHQVTPDRGDLIIINWSTQLKSDYRAENKINETKILKWYIKTTKSELYRKF